MSSGSVRTLVPVDATPDLNIWIQKSRFCLAPKIVPDKVRSTQHGKPLRFTKKFVIPAEVRLYDSLFTKEDPNEVEEGQDFTANLNSPFHCRYCAIEPSMKDAESGTKCQFERLGYYCVGRDSGRNWCSIGPLAFAIRGAKIEKRDNAFPVLVRVSVFERRQNQPKHLA